MSERTWKQTGKTRWHYGDVKVSQRQLKSGFFAWLVTFPDGRERRHGSLEEAKAYVEEVAVT